MSDVKVVYNLLVNNAALIAVVPAVRVYSGKIPQGTSLPALGISHVSTLRRNLVKPGGVQFCTSRVQVTALAKNYPEQKAVLKLVRDALPDGTRGTVAGVKLDSILSDIEGPDFNSPDEEIYMGSHDFTVTFNE